MIKNVDITRLLTFMENSDLLSYFRGSKYDSSCGNWRWN